MSKYVTLDFEKCKACALCLEECPIELFNVGNKKNALGYKAIEIKTPEKCLGNDCLKCIDICPDNAFIKPNQVGNKILDKIEAGVFRLGFLYNKITNVNKFKK